MKHEQRTFTDPDTLERARALLQELAVNEDAGPDTLAEEETSELLLALSDVDNGAFSTSVLAAVDILLGRGDVLEPSVRQRVVATAERAVAARRTLKEGPLPAVLRQQRTGRSTSLDDLANTLGTSARDLRDLESGSLPLTNLPAQTLAQWVHAIRVPEDEARTALRRSLKPAEGQRVYAGGTQEAVSKVPVHDLDEFITAFEAELEKLSGNVDPDTDST
ncbi:hypothetical protein [Phycicoccus sp.]|uniref:hypothetical protein n=1 Tax=Phycicoccus sp. TaxID=1902410 RepID=UPI002CD9986C|nr:hypothetical protein [Phycicoccus sp.]HMM95055.1 hypothetical protein [Phycicoccus sp.]